MEGDLSTRPSNARPWLLLWNRVLSPRPFEEGEPQSEASMGVNRWGRGGKGKGKDPRGLITALFAEGAKTTACSGRPARAPYKAVEKVHFVFRVDNGVGGGATIHRNPPGVQWARHLRGRFETEKNMPSALLQQAIVKKGE